MDNEVTFNLMNNMEFLTDRQLFVSASWDMNGKLLNRLPLLKKLKWREYFSVKAMWGDLTSKKRWRDICRRLSLWLCTAGLYMA